MIFNRFDGNIIFNSIQANGFSGVVEVINVIARSFCDISIKELKEYAKSRIDFNSRKYGKRAELLGPFGYFHPSEIIDVITDNVNRGKLTTKKEKSLYTYDFDFDNEIAMITFPDIGTETICEKKG